MVNQINKVHDGIKEYILELKENSISKKRLKTLDKIINEINKYTVDKLRDICSNNGGSDEGTKQILIDRIINEQYK